MGQGGQWCRARHYLDEKGCRRPRDELHEYSPDQEARYSDGRTLNFVAEARQEFFGQDDTEQIVKVFTAAYSVTEWVEVSELCVKAKRSSETAEESGKEWRGTPLQMGSGMDPYGIEEILTEFDMGDKEVLKPRLREEFGSYELQQRATGAWLAKARGPGC